MAILLESYCECSWRTPSFTVIFTPVFLLYQTAFRIRDSLRSSALAPQDESSATFNKNIGFAGTTARYTIACGEVLAQDLVIL